MSYTIPNSRSKTSSPIKNGSIGPAGEVLCSCKPPTAAILLTVKSHSSPNCGRQFYKCSQPLDSNKCKLFQWYDEMPTNTVPTSPSKFPTSAGNRLGGAAPPPLPSASTSSTSKRPITPSKPPPAPPKPTSPTKKRPPSPSPEVAEEEEDDEMDVEIQSDDSGETDMKWRALFLDKAARENGGKGKSVASSPLKNVSKKKEVESDEDDIEEDEEPDVFKTPTSSPSKKAKFESFSTPSSSSSPLKLSTSSKPPPKQPIFQSSSNNPFQPSSTPSTPISTTSRTASTSPSLPPSPNKNEKALNLVRSIQKRYSEDAEVKELVTEVQRMIRVGDGTDKRVKLLQEEANKAKMAEKVAGEKIKLLEAKIDDLNSRRK